MADKQELKVVGCPFCELYQEGFDSIVVESRHTAPYYGTVKRWYVICSRCGARGPIQSSELGQDRDMAILEWNRVVEMCKGGWEA